jgi:hypothetical protein
VGEYSAIAIRPSVDFSALESVLVVLTPPAVAGGSAGGQGANQDRE